LDNNYYIKTKMIQYQTVLLQYFVVPLIQYLNKANKVLRQARELEASVPSLAVIWLSARAIEEDELGKMTTSAWSAQLEKMKPSSNWNS
jgi:hypothetical protein